MNEPTLKNCPFCGSKAHVTNPYGGGFRAECVKRFDGCPVNARTHTEFRTKEAAATAWNTRKP